MHDRQSSLAMHLLVALVLAAVALPQAEATVPMYDAQHPDANPGPHGNALFAAEKHRFSSNASPSVVPVSERDRMVGGPVASIDDSNAPADARNSDAQELQSGKGGPDDAPIPSVVGDLNTVPAAKSSLPLRARAKASGSHAVYGTGDYYSVGTPVSTARDPDKEVHKKRIAVKNAMVHSWAGYKTFAWGADELRPLSKRGKDWLFQVTHGITFLRSFRNMLSRSVARSADSVRSLTVAHTRGHPSSTR